MEELKKEGHVVQSQALTKEELFNQLYSKQNGVTKAKNPKDEKVVDP